MKSIKPKAFEAWIGGYLGPSYRLELTAEGLVYEIYERGYELYASETLEPSTAEWSRFLNDVALSGIWDWDDRYKGEDGGDGTTWYVTLQAGSQTVVSRGLNHYPPGFVDFLRCVRRLLAGRHFS